MLTRIVSSMGNTVVEFNGAHMNLFETVDTFSDKKKGKTIALRGRHPITGEEPKKDSWYDAKHRRVMIALNELHDAIADMVKNETSLHFE